MFWAPFLLVTAVELPTVFFKKNYANFYSNSYDEKELLIA
jgi:hypothetical protein